MENGFITNNAELSGTVTGELRESHRSYGETFYQFPLGIERKSGYVDEIQIIVSERLVWKNIPEVGTRVHIGGQVRTYNEMENGRSRLNVTVFAREFSVCAEECGGEGEDENCVYLSGFLCKEPVLRISPLGREICDIMLAVNRMYNKSDYIPCIAWGRNAIYAGSLDVGSPLTLTGRIQSREYRKKDEEGGVALKVAYEVSIVKIEA